MKTPYQVVAYFCSELASYKLFVEISERNWIEENNRYTSSLFEDNETEAFRFSYRTDLSSKLNEDFPQLQRKSYLIMLVSIFEDFMNDLCRSIEFQMNLNISFNEFSGSGIERAKKYLSKLSPISLPVNGAEWQTIKKAQEIRNIVAHNAGHIDNQKHLKQLEIVKRNKNLEAEHYARTHLKIESLYILDLIDSMHNFSSKLLEECLKTI
ncbi:MAG: hypothetical protein H7Z73_06140 [Candidatus Saccharibacteria bacterium]|nr:hypothetical protein [Moraxellaceae bacterium]